MLAIITTQASANGLGTGQRGGAGARTKAGSGEVGGISQCEPLNTDLLQLCENIAYNQTRFPNYMKQNSQQEAATDSALYLPLVRINCSPVLKLFLCSLYAPPCVGPDYTDALKPCREMCERAKRGCQSYMKRFAYDWPEYIDCWRFPSFNGPEACVTDQDYLNQQQQQQPIQEPERTRPVISRPKSQTQQKGLTQNQNSNAASNIFSNLTPEQLQLLLKSLTSNNINNNNNNYNNIMQQSSDHQSNLGNSPSQLNPGLNFNFQHRPQNSPNNNRQSLNSLQYSTNQNQLISHHQNQNQNHNQQFSIIVVRFVCPPMLRLLSDTKQTYHLQVGNEQVTQCGMPCSNNLYSNSEVAFARSWVLVWSSICFVSTLFTMLTYMLEKSRFRYPERPIIFISGCYMLVGLGYLIGSSSLHSNALVCQPQKNAKYEYLDFLVQGVEHVPCTLLFMMIYFFGMASSIWWVVLTLTWFLAAGLKWGHEAIENISSYFHLAAWALPGIKMIAILWLQKVDADILSGVCYTGLRDTSILRGFVLAPLFLYLILGTCFLMAGFVSLFRIRNLMKHEGNKTEKLEKFMIRICVFSILYMVPAIIVIVCYFYEQASYPKWIDYWLKKNYAEFNVPPDYAAQSLFEVDRSALVFSMFMIKYGMLLVVGITSGFWIWSPKTIASWQRLFDRVFVCCRGMRAKSKHEAAV